MSLLLFLLLFFPRSRPRTELSGTWQSWLSQPAQKTTKSYGVIAAVVVAAASAVEAGT